MAFPIKAHAQSYGGRGPVTLIEAWILFAIGSIIVGLRVYSTLFIVHRKGKDLVWILIAYFIALLSHVWLVTAVYFGAGNHLKSIHPDDVAGAVFWNYMFDTIAILSGAFGKFAIVALLLEVQGKTHHWARRVLLFLAGSTMFLTVMQIIITWMGCQPPQKLWYPQTPGSCGLTYYFLRVGVFVGSWQATTDFTFAIWPSVIFWSLQASWKKRAGLSALFLGGTLAGAAAILKTVYLLILVDLQDPTYDSYVFNLWALIEMWLIIIMGSVPTLRPLLVKIPGMAKSLTHRSHSTSPSARALPISAPLEASRTGATSKHSRMVSTDSGEKIIGQKPSHDTLDLTDLNSHDVMVTRDLDVTSDSDLEGQRIIDGTWYDRQRV